MSNKNNKREDVARFGPAIGLPTGSPPPAGGTPPKPLTAMTDAELHAAADSAKAELQRRAEAAKAAAAVKAKADNEAFLDVFMKASDRLTLINALAPDHSSDRRPEYACTDNKRCEDSSVYYSHDGSPRCARCYLLNIVTEGYFPDLVKATLRFELR